MSFSSALSLFTPTSTFQDLAHVLSFRNLSPNLHVVVLKRGLQIIKFDTRLLESGWAGVSTSVTFYTLDAEIGCQLTDPETCYWVTRKATFMIRMCSAWDELVRPAGIRQPQSTQDSDAAHLSSRKSWQSITSTTRLSQCESLGGSECAQLHKCSPAPGIQPPFPA